MQRQLLFKIIIIACLAILLMIPLVMIRSIVSERMLLRDGVVKEIASSSANSQRIIGPVIIVPYTKISYVPIQGGGDKDNRIVKEVVSSGKLYFLPEVFTLNGDLQVEKRYRGIYEAQLYHLDNQITGEFSIPKNFGISENLANYNFLAPYMVMGISDIRGINSELKLTLNNEDLTLVPGTEGSVLGSGVHALMAKDKLLAGGVFNFSIAFKLQGTSSLHIAPVGRESNVTLTSNWPHPSFMGDFLPANRDVTSQGFKANWQANFFATNLEEKMGNCLNSAHCEQFNSPSFTVGLIDTVDQYLKTDRAIKYALLIIGLTFVGFFLFEVVKHLAIHPIQYSFVGVALATFFLLLLSLAEYIGFSLAYFCSAVACIIVIGFYVAGILQNKKQTLIFITMLISLYIMLYVILSAEEDSLLMGSLLVFILLSAGMVITRKLDWYQVASLPKLYNQTKREEIDHE